MKKLILILLPIALCISLCACRNNDNDKPNSEKELCANVQREMLAALKDYCQGNISKSDLHDTLWNIYDEMDSDVCVFRSIVTPLDYAFSDEWLEDWPSRTKDDQTDYLRTIENMMYNRPLDNTDDREVKLAAQAREDIQTIFNKYWNMEIDGNTASEEIDRILVKWEKDSDTVAFYDELDDIYNSNFTPPCGIDNRDDAQECIERIEKFDFD